jgi:translocation and assembly module TamA
MAAEGDPPGGYPYQVSIAVDGPDAEDLTPLLQGVSQLASLEATPPFSRLGLSRRVESDRSRFGQALRSRGYYGARVAVQVAEAPPDGGPAQVTIAADPGTVYGLARVVVEYRDLADRAGLPEDLEATGLILGDPARSADIIAAQERLDLALRKAGRPLAKVVDRRAVVDHRSRTMEITYVVDAGPPAAFGALNVEGLTSVKRRLLERMVPWTEGDRYDEEVVREFRKRLAQSRLFATIRLGPSDAVGADGRVPMDLEVTEAAHRTVALGAAYATDGGPGVTARWEHRNLLGGGEKFRADLVGALYEQSLELSFRRPYFPDSRQSLIAGARVAREDLTAYTGVLGETSLGLEREMGEHWRVSAALAGEYADLVWHGDGRDESRGHALAGLPMTAERDDTDNLLNPTEGSRLAFSFLPYAGMVDGAATAFATFEAKGATYYEVVEDRLVLAGRARLASLAGADLDVIPPNHRLYAGGGGSVRGFGHDMIGPLDSGGDPTGGKSAAEIGFETRIKVTETIGLVPFIEGGLVNADPWPTLDEEIRWGAGLGVRYYTDFGPLRADIAIPLNPRNEDDWFQVYFSLGQAF